MGERYLPALFNNLPDNKCFPFRTMYHQMIVGELEKNYKQISDMYEKLMREEREDQTL